MNLLPPVACVVPIVKDWWGRNFDFIWIAAIPALLFLIAGIKLQFRLNSIDNVYEHVLSLDGMDIMKDFNVLRFSLEFSNAIHRPVKYEFIPDKVSVKIGESNSTLMQPCPAATISANKKSMTLLSEIGSPVAYPCEAVLHYELYYGHTKRYLFRQVREYSIGITLDPYTSPSTVRFQAHCTQEEDIPIRK